MDISVVILTRSSKNILQKQAKKQIFRNLFIQTNQPSGTLSEAEAHSHQSSTINHQSSIINHQSSIINHQQTANYPSPTFTIN
ncbi:MULTISPECIES: hypothetical protein [unclassified Chryseobacterium]|uniref:hypothetical protein n=1 Tax=unclassified Chryseobacterium TaxID=2593645 RepID=UPI0013FD7027|nr:MULTISPECIES: hypothetical protein [unclassified Chryseobacterium]